MIWLFINHFSTVSRGYVVTSGSAIVNPESAIGAAISNSAAYHSGVEDISSASGSETASGSNSRKSSDETAIVVSGRKNSMTKAVRYDDIIHYFPKIDVQFLGCTFVCFNIKDNLMNLISDGIQQNINGTRRQCGKIKQTRLVDTINYPSLIKWCSIIQFFTCQYNTRRRDSIFNWLKRNNTKTNEWTTFDEKMSQEIYWF